MILKASHCLNNNNKDNKDNKGNEGNRGVSEQAEGQLRVV
jgi:hypothetical protein